MKEQRKDGHTDSTDTQTHKHVDKLGSGSQGSLMERQQHGEAQLCLLFTAEPHPGDTALPFSLGSWSRLCPCEQHTGTQGFTPSGMPLLPQRWLVVLDRCYTPDVHPDLIISLDTRPSARKLWRDVLETLEAARVQRRYV